MVTLFLVIPPSCDPHLRSSPAHPMRRVVFYIVAGCFLIVDILLGRVGNWKAQDVRKVYKSILKFYWRNESV